MKTAKETRIQGKGQEVEACLRKNNCYSKKAYQLVKDLTTEKQGKSTTIHDKSGKYLAEENEILDRWTEYCANFYNYETDWDPIVTAHRYQMKSITLSMRRGESSSQSAEEGKPAVVDNIPAALVQAGGEAMIKYRKQKKIKSI